MSITRSGIVNIFTSATQQLELQKQSKQLKRLKNVIQKRKSQLKSNKQNFGFSKKSIKQIDDSNDKQQKKKPSKRLEKFKQITDHKDELQTLQRKYNTDFQKGLSQLQAQKRLQEAGQNIFTQKYQTPQILLYLKQMSDPFSLFLWFLTVISFIYYGVAGDSNGLMLVIILLIVIFSGATIQYIYNKDSAKTIDSIKSIIPLYCNVIRDGIQKTILVQKLVKGDIVIITPGLKIPADLRIIQCHGLRSDNAIYTGQSKNVHNSVICSDKQLSNPFLAKNMMFSGVINVEGTGKGLVINTGNDSLFSQIADVLLSQEQKPKFIQAQIQWFVIVVTLFSLGIGVFTFFGGYLTGFRIIIAVMIAIGDTVACVPGVLNLQVTVMFTLAVRKLAKRNIICKNLWIVQNLGSTSCLCTDKTGTLTKNQQTVSQLWMNNQFFKCINKDEPGSDRFYDQYEEDPLLKDIQKCAILTSIAKFQTSPSKRQIEGIYSRKDLSKEEKVNKELQLRSNWNLKIQNLKYSERPMIGNPVQIALTHFFQPIEDINYLKQKHPYYIIHSKRQINDQKTKSQKTIQSNQIALKTFKSEDKYSMSINKVSLEQDQYEIYCKGAPETIWNMCRYVMVNRQIIEKEDFYNAYDKALQYFADKGQTVIAFSKMIFDQNSLKKDLSMSPPNFEHDEQIFLGFISFQDPPKKGVPQTIQRIRVAGIKVVMITGDQQKIATKVAKSCNIITQEKTVNQIMRQENISFEKAFGRSQALVVQGKDIDKILGSDQFTMREDKQRALMRLLDKRQVIFAKTTPAHKMYIVQVLQKMGHIVTVTGDGTNDSTALKISNCGICMGSGSDIAKDCADIIISDDDFNKILQGIEEGRKIFDNLKKAIVYVMTSQISQFMPFVLLIFSKIPIPIFTLLIDAPVDFVTTISYVFEQGQSNIMTRKPKDPSTSLINGRLLGQASGWMGFSGFLCCLCCYYLCMIDFGFIPLQLWQKNSIPMMLPGPADTYNPTDPLYGNSNLVGITTCDQYNSQTTNTDFINSSYPTVDMRMAALVCRQDPATSQISFHPYMEYGICRLQQISIYTGRPVCYTSQAAKYGQTAYCLGNFICQVFNLFMCKSSRQSVFSMRINNKVMICGLALQFMFVLLLTNVYYLIYMIGTRDNVFIHYGLPGLLFGLVQFTVDQLRKWLIRNYPRQNFGDPNRSYDKCKPNWFQRNTKW